MSSHVGGDERQSSVLSVLGLKEHQKQLVKAFPNPNEHPFPVRLPAHPEDPDPERDQALYHLPGYQYPHTLTFVNDFSVEAEAQMIRDFDQARPDALRRMDRIPLAQTFRANADYEAPTNGGGWGIYIKDLVEMGLGWAAQRLGLTIPIANDRESISPPSPMAQLAAESTPRHTNCAAALPAAKRRKITKDRSECVRNGGGPTSFLPATAFDPDGSDTESEDDDDLTSRFINKNPVDTRKAETVFGPGVIVTRSFGGTLYAVLEDEQKVEAQEVKNNRWVEEVDQDTEMVDRDIQYPNLPPLSSLSIVEEEGPPHPSSSLPHNPATYPRPPTPQAMQPLPKPMPPEVQASAGPNLFYRPRYPEDSVFHRSSAGINPLGAHARPVHPLPRRVTDNIGRARGNVSGSFGSFEQKKPSRFEERRYRLLPGSAGDKRKNNS